MTGGFNYEDRHPDDYSTEELEGLGHTKTPLLKVLRTYCRGCCAGNLAEVRRCHISRCELWPYRMGTNPLRPPATPKQRQKSRERMRQLQNAGSGTCESDNTENHAILAAEKGAA